MADTHFKLQDGLLEAALARPSQPVQAGSALPRDAHVAVLRDVRAFLALEDQWRGLEAQSSPRRNVFQSFGWLKSWAVSYGGARGESPLSVALGYRDGALVFAWPLMRVKSGPLTFLRWMSEPFGQYGDVLVAPGECPVSWMSEALRELSSQRGVDGLRLRHVRADAVAAPFLRQCFRDTRFDEKAPWLDLTAFAGETAYDARYSPAQRKRRKKIRKGLEDAFGPVRFDLYRGGHAADTAIERAIAEKSQWIDERGRQNRVLGCPRITDFLKGLSRASAGMELVVSELSAGDRPVSWEIGLRAGGVHYAFITSHVNALTDYSPARLHMDLSQRQALKDGMAAFDLMLPHDAYKDSWSSGATPVNDYFLPLSPQGWAYGALYLERLRPVLRHAYYRMPPALLRLLKPITGH